MENQFTAKVTMYYQSEMDFLNIMDRKHRIPKIPRHLKRSTNEECFGLGVKVREIVANHYENKKHVMNMIECLIHDSYYKGEN